MNQKALLKVFAFVGVGIAARTLFKHQTQSQSRFADVDRRLKEMIQEEESQTRPFPKEISLEPASE